MYLVHHNYSNEGPECQARGKATTTSFKHFGLQGIEPTTFRDRGGGSNHYTTAAVQ